MYPLTTFIAANHDPRSLGGNTAICLGKRGGAETACDTIGRHFARQQAGMCA